MILQRQIVRREHLYPLHMRLRLEVEDEDKQISNSHEHPQNERDFRLTLKAVTAPYTRVPDTTAVIFQEGSNAFYESR